MSDSLNELGRDTNMKKIKHLIFKSLNLSGLDLRGACSPGPALDCSRQNNLKPEQCGQGDYMRRERGQTQCG